MSEFVQFLGRAVAHWFFWVGILFTPWPFMKKALTSALPRLHLPRLPWLWIVGAACLFWSFFSAWKEEHTKVLELTEKAAHNLSGEFGQVLFGIRNDLNLTEVHLELSVNNLGAPTIVRGYKLLVNLPDGRNYEAMPAYLAPDTVLWHRDGSPMTTPMQPGDELDEKTAEHPVESGGSRTGWLRYALRGVILNPVPVPLLCRVILEDVTGKTFVVQKIFNEMTNAGESALPGARPWLIPPSPTPTIPTTRTGEIGRVHLP